VVTSRRETDIEAVVKPLPTNFDVNLSNFQNALTSDISLYIRQSFEEPFCSWPDNVREKAASALIKKADGGCKAVY
jgi:hypothetical protein